MNIEIKAQAYEHRHPPDAIEKQVVALIKQKNMQDSILISSFEIDIPGANCFHGETRRPSR